MLPLLFVYWPLSTVPKMTNVGYKKACIQYENYTFYILAHVFVSVQETEWKIYKGLGVSESRSSK